MCLLPVRWSAITCGVSGRYGALARSIPLRHWPATAGIQPERPSRSVSQRTAYGLHLDRCRAGGGCAGEAEPRPTGEPGWSRPGGWSRMRCLLAACSLSSSSLRSLAFSHLSCSSSRLELAAGRVVNDGQFRRAGICVERIGRTSSAHSAIECQGRLQTVWPP